MSNNIYDILKKIESLEAPKKQLTESKMSTVKELHNESKKEKQTNKGTIAEAVAKVEKQLSEKFQGFKKSSAPEIGSNLPKSDTETFGLQPGRGYDIKTPKDWKPGDKLRDVRELIPTQDKKDHIRSRLGKHVKPAHLPEGTVEESGLMYHAGVKKHGKKYMDLAKEAGQKGASQEELGRLKDKHSKAYKNKKMDEGPLTLAAPAVAALGGGETLKRAKDDDQLGALSSAMATSLSGLGMIPGPQQPYALGGSLGLMGVNQLRDAAKRAGGWKELGKQIFTSPDPDHTFLPEDFDKLDLIANLLERSGQIDKDGSLSKLIITEWGPDASKWLVKKFSKGKKLGEAYVTNPRLPSATSDDEDRYEKERAIYGDPNNPLAQKGFQRAQDIHGRLHKVMKKKPNLKVSEADYNEDMLSPKQKSFAALAEPKDKITYADKIAGAKKGKKDESNKYIGNLMKARADGKDEADLDGDGDMEKVKPGMTTMREGWEEMQKYLDKKKGPQSKGGEGKKAGTRYGGSAQKDDDDEETDGEGKPVEKKRGRPKGTGGGAKFSFKKPKD